MYWIKWKCKNIQYQMLNYWIAVKCKIDKDKAKEEDNILWEIK